MDSTQGFHAIMSVFLLPMWLLSGAFFPMDVGGWLGWIVRLNPLTYGVAGLRHYLQNDSIAAGLPSLAVCWLVSLVFAGVMFAAAWWIAGTRSTARLAMSTESDHNSDRRKRRRRARRCVRPARRCRIFCAAPCCSAMAYGGWKWWQVRQFELRKGEAIPADAIGPPLTEFELTERSGKPFRSADMSGKVWVASVLLHDLPRPVPSAEREHPSAQQRARS